MNIECKPLKGNWKLFILKNNHGMEVHILNYGGVISKIIVPDKFGMLENVVLGYNHEQEYESDTNFFGAIIGRVAGRIKGACFELNGKRYELEANDGRNNLHSGSNGFHRVIWEAEPFENDHEVGIRLSYLSKDGENSYPGNVAVAVIYTLNNNNQLSITYNASTDQTTVITLTNHSYFNLSGNLKNTIHNHHVTMNSSQFVELNQELIPTGKLVDAQHTLFDFQEGRKLGDGFTVGSEQNRIVGQGYDHYFLFNKNELGNVVVKDEVSGRFMSIKTDQPGMVVYTSNNLGEGMELAGAVSQKYLGVCFETQSSPASLHHEDFPTVQLNIDEEYKRQTVFTFGVES